MSVQKARHRPEMSHSNFSENDEPSCSLDQYITGPPGIWDCFESKSSAASSSTLILLSCLIEWVICPAINTGIFCTTKAGIRSPQFSFVPVNKPSFFSFSFWAQSSIAASIISQIFSKTIISILYYTEQSIPGYVKFFMITVSSFQYIYYNCINISCLPSTLLHKSITFAQLSFSFQSKCSNIGKQTIRWLFFLSFYLPVLLWLFTCFLPLKFLIFL